MIDGIVFKELATHGDERGFFREIIRVSDDFFVEGVGQWSHSIMFEGVIKAWHFHNVQTDWWWISISTGCAVRQLRERIGRHGQLLT